MKSDQRTRALFAVVLPSEATELAPNIFTLVQVDDVTWHRVRISDGSLAWAGRCPGGGGYQLHTGFTRIKPTALRCRCGRWHRLP